MDKLLNIDILMKQAGINKSLSSDKTIEPLYKMYNMNYTEVETMALHLSLQLQTLEEQGCGLLFLQESDIVVVDKCIYVLEGLAQVVPLHKKGKKGKKYITLTYPSIYPFPKDVCAPEVLAISVLPFITYKSASYYSLALLCLKMLRLSLEDLVGTPLYFFLERCLKEDPLKRILLNATFNNNL